MPLDESDVTLVLNPKYQKYLEFDRKKQKIRIMYGYWDEENKKKVRLTLPADIPEELKLFVVANISLTLRNISSSSFKSFTT